MNTCAELLKKYLEEKKFNFKTSIVKDGDSLIEFPYQGKIARMFFSGDEGQYLSIYVEFERVPEDKKAEAIFACNQMNVQYKWVTFYVDNDKDLILHLALGNSVGIFQNSVSQGGLSVIYMCNYRKIAYMLLLFALH